MQSLAADCFQRARAKAQVTGKKCISQTRSMATLLTPHKNDADGEELQRVLIVLVAQSRPRGRLAQHAHSQGAQPRGVLSLAEGPRTEGWDMCAAHTMAAAHSAFASGQIAEALRCWHAVLCAILERLDSSRVLCELLAARCKQRQHASQVCPRSLGCSECEG